MALPPIRGIAALLKHLSKGGKGTARKPLHRLAADRSDPFQINAKPVRSLPRITDEPPGLRRAGRRPSARERREERIAGVMRRKTPKERTDLEDWELERILAGDERAIERLMTHRSVRPPARRPGDV